MISKHLPSHWEQFCSKFSVAPIELRAFCLFASITTFLGLLMHIIKPRNIMRAIVPYTGWGFSSGYSVALFFTFMLLFASRRRVKSINLIYGAIIPLMGINVLFEIGEFLHFQDDNFGNPYLTITIWQPVWTVILPLFWIAILLSGNVRKFCKTLDAVATR